MRLLLTIVLVILTGGLLFGWINSETEIHKEKAMELCDGEVYDYRQGIPKDEVECRNGEIHSVK